MRIVGVHGAASASCRVEKNVVVGIVRTLHLADSLDEDDEEAEEQSDVNILHDGIQSKGPCLQAQRTPQRIHRKRSPHESAGNGMLTYETLNKIPSRRWQTGSPPNDGDRSLQRNQPAYVEKPLSIGRILHLLALPEEANAGTHKLPRN
jgi:hypothetical protein